jgi:menaquinone-9 beta-reductase
VKKLETQILIIGGGPAGSTTALYLSRLGYKIILVEKKVFPRETLCGEFLSKEVTDVLKELNIFDDFINLKPTRINSFKAVDSSGIEVRCDINFEAFALKRSVFDTFLLEKARSRMINIIQPAEVVTVLKNNSDFISEVKINSRETVTINSKLVIAAYGKQNIMDKRMQREFVKEKSNLNGVKFHLPVSLLNNISTNEIIIYTDRGFYCGMNRVNENEMTVCFLEDRKTSKIPLREKLIEMIQSSKKFNKVFTLEAINYIRTVNLYGTGNIYFGKKNLIENDIIMIGDCARVIAPLAGDGIGMAMESAKILSNSISINNINESHRENLYLDYRKNFEKAFNNRIKVASISQKLILDTLFRKIGFRIVNRYPSILSSLVKYTRVIN